MTGSGTLADPYVIWNVNDLQNVSLDLTAYYELGQDIDATGFPFTPIGWFTGSFDGKGHTIISLTINLPAVDDCGLFSYASVATIKNFNMSCSIRGRCDVGAVAGWLHESHFENIHVTGSVIGTGNGMGGCTWVGGLGGWGAYNYFTDCSFEGTVTGSYGMVGGLLGQVIAELEGCWSKGTVQGTGGVGGLTGNQEGGTYINCYSEANVIATSGGISGGISGYGGNITRCYSTGNVTCTGDRCGGLVGWSFGSLVDSYTHGNVSGHSEIGGLVGYNYGSSAKPERCYSKGLVTGTGSYIGGLVGRNYYGTVINSFWDTQTSGQALSDGGTGKTTAEMKVIGTYWATWPIYESLHDYASGYPFLGWQEDGLCPAWRIQDLSATPPPSNVITTLDGLQHIRFDRHGTYELGCDIDATLTQTWNWNGIRFLGFQPIGQKAEDCLQFYGIFDGKGHKIIGLYIDRPAEDRVGLFGYAKGAILKNLVIEYATIVGHSYVGTLVGWAENCTIEKVDIDNTSIQAYRYSGGLIGYLI